MMIISMKIIKFRKLIYQYTYDSRPADDDPRGEDQAPHGFQEEKK